MTSLVVTSTAGGPHYSMVVTTTRGPTDEYDVHTVSIGVLETILLYLNVTGYGLCFIDY